jgi:hypothetical protein
MWLFRRSGLLKFPHASNAVDRIPGVVAMAILTLGLHLPVSPGRAEGAENATGTEAPSQPETSREAWLKTVDEAKKRATEAAIERRKHPERYEPPREDPDAIATERVLNDESLAPGDIVATKNGLFVFRGRPGQERRTDDFLPVPPAGKPRQIR